MVRHDVGLSSPPASLYRVSTKGIGLEGLGNSRPDCGQESPLGGACDWVLIGIAKCESCRDRFRLVVLMAFWAAIVAVDV